MVLQISELRIIPRVIQIENLGELAEHIREGMLVQDFEHAINIGRPYGCGSIGGIEFRIPYYHLKQDGSQILNEVDAMVKKRGLEMEPIMHYIDDSTGSEVKFYRLKKL